ncbi:TM0106 family RecB-like putative nuclease [Nakamurella silvestris]|nr:TM0106 family RecB-like putative nuclease [Nakamurella silvestris]
MFLLDDHVIYGASDLANAAQCEFALLREFDVELGRLPRGTAEVDPMLVRTSALGDAHEQAYLTELTATFGDYDPAAGSGVLTDLAAPRYDRDSLEARHRATIDALRAGADVIYQGSFFDGRFNGRSDFLVKGPDGRYTVVDTKLARQAKVTALLQIAGYAEQLGNAGVPTADVAQLLLGNGEMTTYRLADLLPVYRDRRERLQAVLDEHHAELTAALWGDPRYLACGRCDTCSAEVESHRDLLLVAGLLGTQRAALHSVGITTIDELAAADTRPEDIRMSAGTWSTLQRQAALQVEQRPPGGPVGPVRAVVIDTEPLRALPPPDAGDIFFDFEGDPLWAESGSRDWGLEYLFGVVEAPVVGVDGTEEPTVFRPFWAHSRQEEAGALREFLGYLAQRRARYPNMHVYHYAAYEKSALLRLAVRHNFGEEQVDNLLREGVLVDLYSTVRGSIMISQPSYSIKKLEPLYMDDDRAGEVTTASASIDVYYRYTLERQAGHDVEADALLTEIADYNEYDCVSTLRLRDWLLERAAEQGVVPRGPVDPVDPTPRTDADEAEADTVVRTLLAAVPDRNRTEDDQAVAFVAAAVAFHSREGKPFWWSHFARLVEPVDEWPDRRDIFLASRGVRALTDWGKTAPRQRKARRSVELYGDLEEGSTLAPGSTVYTVYEPPLAEGLETSGTGFRATNSGAQVISVEENPTGGDLIVIEEMTPGKAGPFDQLPMALAPGAPPMTTSIERALLGLAGTVAAGLPALPPHPGIDILRLVDPRTVDGRGLAVPGTDNDRYIDAITDSVSRLDRSYLAVQGPPGTGKTHVGARVIKRLVEQGWRIGVVAQSHAAVENMLAGVIKAGVPAAQVAKEHKTSVPLSWTSMEPKQYAAFLDDHADTGGVVGGTAWTFTNPNQIPPGSLDLVVIDEAGQFSLANTLAVSTAAPRLLLLGDPQQLPQVSQGTHPEPVDGSALAHLAHGHAALPERRGYFLEKTWRMHPAVCTPVSLLAYDGKLVSEESHTATRNLAGRKPGISVNWVEHHGNSVQSTEEAAEVVRLVREHLDLEWTDPGSGDAVTGHTRQTGQQDVLVVAPYNAQVSLIRRTLAAAGLAEIQVGTVDKFQGKQAPVVIVSMTASAVADVPRGMSFLLSRNRMNVAVSRAQWAAVIVRSPALTDYLPTTPENLAELGAFIGLCGG